MTQKGVRGVLFRPLSLVSSLQNRGGPDPCLLPGDQGIPQLLASFSLQRLE